MKNHTRGVRFVFDWAAALLLALAPAARAQSTAFTYQGRLDDGGIPANGLYDLRLALYDAASTGTQQGNTLTNAATAVSNGLFTVTLDFGNQFPGADRWLEIGVRTNGGAAFNLLTPRQLITATPYAVQAANAATALGVSGPVAAAQLTGTIASNNIAAGSISTTMLATGAVGANQLAAGAVTTSALADGAVTAIKLLQAQDVSLSTTFTNPTPLSGEEFGYKLAAVGADKVLIGAYRDETVANDVGEAYLFSTNGTLLTTFANPTPEADDLFAVSVAAVGLDQVIIGAPLDDTGAINSGAAYLFDLNGNLIVTITNPIPSAGAGFGGAVAALGSASVLIAARSHANVGAAYLYSADGILLTTFTNPTPEVGDRFGGPLAALGNDRVLVAANEDDTGASNAGAVYLFSTDGTLLTTFTNPAPTTDAYFGNSVAAVGSDRVLIGAYYQKVLGVFYTGAAYLFSTNGTLLTTFTNPTPQQDDFFGISVAGVGSDRVLISAWGDDTGAPTAGAAYLFNTAGTLLNTITNPAPAQGDLFGAAVAVVGADQLLIGANGDDTGATSAGAAYLFSLADYAPHLVAEGVRVGAITTANLEDGAVTAAKIGGVLSPSQIPDLDAAKIVSGTLNPNRIPNLEAAKITSGTLADARLSTNVALLNRSPQTFTGPNTFTNTVIVTGPFYGSPPYLKFWEVRPKGTDGGANVAGTNNFREFTKSIDTHALGSTNGSGDIVLPAGTYQCRISAPGYRVNSHQARLRTTAGPVLLYGTTEYSDNVLSPGVQSRSVVEGQFTLLATTTTQVQHYMQVVRSPNGLGVAGNPPWTDGSPVEVYTVAEFWKIK